MRARGVASFLFNKACRTVIETRLIHSTSSRSNNQSKRGPIFSYVYMYATPCACSAQPGQPYSSSTPQVGCLRACVSCLPAGRRACPHPSLHHHPLPSTPAGEPPTEAGEAPAPTAPPLALLAAFLCSALARVLLMDLKSAWIQIIVWIKGEKEGEHNIKLYPFLLNR